MIKKSFYIALDIVLVTGLFLNLLVFPDKSLVGVSVAALIMTLIHQKYDEKKYFKNMFEQGRLGFVWGWIFWRWMLTLVVIASVVAGVLDAI